MLVTKTKAAKLAGISRRTFYNHIPKKKISVKIDDDGEEKIDVSELERIYGLETVRQNMQNLEGSQSNVSNTVQSTHKVTPNDINEITLLKEKVGFLETRLTASEEEKDRWHEAFEKEQLTANQITRLIEDHNNSKETNEWEKSFKALEERIANQEKVSQEEKQKILGENLKLKKAIKIERSKSVWQKLFG